MTKINKYAIAHPVEWFYRRIMFSIMITAFIWLAVFILTYGNLFEWGPMPSICITIGVPDSMHIPGCD